MAAYVDDVRWVDVTAQRMQPPWKGTYKLRSTDTGKLTAADVVGPDGIVYPDWTYAGVPGGIPAVPVQARQVLAWRKDPPRPQPKVSSIFAWQRQHKNRSNR